MKTREEENKKGNILGGENDFFFLNEKQCKKEIDTRMRLNVQPPSTTWDK